MGPSSIPQLTPEEQYHVDIMKLIVQSLNGTPYVLKGGTSLLLGYGLDRFSEDLDFDSGKKLDLESKIRSSMPKDTHITNFRVAKNSEDNQRYIVTFSNGEFARRLKIETKFIDEIPEDEINIIDGMQISSISRIIDGKTNAFINRTAIRDLYDVDFLLRNYINEFSEIAKKRVVDAFENEMNILDEYREAYDADAIISNRIELTDLILSILSEIEKIKSVPPGP
ncbi:nucleotidyl transferase AbiEii/AbiGii toxin family protein [Gluconobacter cerinus]|uniref:nucleotidyl transferase AbiEii/AbiGii toxin family protein n=1 Tax=Gluconobacter cerinus TaxID=38307 RepID=UPI001B8B37BF|nr:nucleotidyl transferase AbiEii/AbiGii toxin family protein [Gluconobacter cerinus]MBS1038104.1 nucleotidyl transferase AbiEii/AbiGii toxin family protein [Gluconobacter cerinus]